MTITTLCNWTRQVLRAPALGLIALLALAGCNSELYSNLSEREANQMVRVLAEAGISANRANGEDGKFSVSVSSGDMTAALSELSRNGLPAQQFRSLGEVFNDEKLVSTPLEERARLMHAVNEELSSSISQIAGVASSRVFVNLPEKGIGAGAASTPRASVFIYQFPGAQLEEMVPTIKNLIVNSVDGMLYENVEVGLFTSTSVSGAVPSGRIANRTSFNSFISVLVLAGLAIGALVVLRRPKSTAPRSAANGAAAQGGAPRSTRIGWKGSKQGGKA